MYRHVTVVPADKLILVEGLALRFDFEAPERLHALQWHEGKGHLEFTDGAPNQPLSEADYAAEVAVFAAAWEAEKQRQEEAAAAAEAARLAEYNSPAARAQRLRLERDKRLSATDYLLMQDYPLTEETRQGVRAYREALRDLPCRPGFPWDGGGQETPWPDAPSAAEKMPQAGQ